MKTSSEKDEQRTFFGWTECSYYQKEKDINIMEKHDLKVINCS